MALAAIRVQDRVLVRGITALPAAVLDLLEDLPAAPQTGHTPLVTAAEDRLAADPLLRLEVETTDAEAAAALTAAAESAAGTARRLLARWAGGHAEVFTDIVPLAEADAVACWANGVYVDLRTADLAAADRTVAVGEGEAVNDLLRELGVAPAGAEELSARAMLFACLAGTLAAAVSGRLGF